jgi:hypothetical protein
MRRLVEAGGGQFLKSREISYTRVVWDMGECLIGMSVFGVLDTLRKG